MKQQSLNEQVRFYEELSFNSHPSLETQYYDGWILRFSNGYTSRANSVNMIYPSTIDLQTKVEYCETRYALRQQACIFKVTDGSDPQLDGLLEQRGYEVVTPTDLMTMDLWDKQFTPVDAVITDHPTKEWLDAYFTMDKRTDAQTRATAEQMMNLIQQPTLYCRIVEEGKTIGCASAIIERGHMTLVHVIVDESYRGYGYGRKVCETMLAAAKGQGAHTAYLQVVQSNRVAVNLYEKLGYRKIYSYWYRRKK